MKPTTSTTTATSAGRHRFNEVYGLGEVIIAKQRHGPIGTIKLHFDADTTKFDNFMGPDHLPTGA